MTKRLAIIQSNYIPWKGYFDFINLVDEFVLFDDVQYTVRDWRNRNRIKTRDGLRWLTIPVQVKGKRFQKIRDTQVTEPSWRHDHWRAFQHSYARAEYFREFRSFFEDLFLGSTT